MDEEARMQWQRNTLGQSTGPERTDASAARYADACRQVSRARGDTNSHLSGRQWPEDGDGERRS